jgi:hypothetical protein
MNPRTLFVSNFWKEARIPLRNVRGIDKSLITQVILGGQVVVYFWNRTEFGDRIIFMPRWDGQVFSWARPIEDELLNAVAAAGGSGVNPPDQEPTNAATS